MKRNVAVQLLSARERASPLSSELGRCVFPRKPLLKHVLLLCMSTCRTLTACMLPDTHTELCNSPCSYDTQSIALNHRISHKAYAGLQLFLTGRALGRPRCDVHKLRQATGRDQRKVRADPADVPPQTHLSCAIILRHDVPPYTHL